MSGTDFPGLHNTARHTAHATETVNVASDVFSRMATQCEALAARQEQNTAEAEAMYERFETLKFLHSIMIGIGARSASNEKRLSNEINLVGCNHHHLIETLLTSPSTGIQHDGSKGQ